MNVKRVAIDKNPLISGHKIRGVGFHTRNLIDEFKNIKGSNFKIDVVDFEKTDLTKYDLVHYQYFNPYIFSIPKTFPTKAVVTIHDLIYLIYPKAYPAGIKGKINLDIQKKRIKKADAIITISNTSKKDILRFLGVDPQKIYPIHLAASNIFRKLEDGKWKGEIKKRYQLPDSFVLYVGDVNYNKNLLNLIKACKLIKTHLVIVGKQAQEIEELGTSLRNLQGPRDWFRFLFNIPHPELAHYENLLREFKANPNIIRLGYVPDEDLNSIYNIATLYCQPSFNEGFGLPVLQAMSSGTAVVASDIPTHKEIAQDTVLYANPESHTDMAQKLKKLITNQSLREKLIEKGLIRARNYSWKKTAEETLAVYSKVLR